LPEEVLQDILVNAQMLEEAGAEGALPHGEMPGGLPGDDFVHLNFGGEDDVEGEDPTVGGMRERAPVGDEAPPEDEEDEEEGVEEVSDFLPSLLPSVLNRVRLHPCLFVCCVIWSADFGVAPMPKRKAHQRMDHKKRQT
jgi:hypothetical protein